MKNIYSIFCINRIRRIRRISSGGDIKFLISGVMWWNFVDLVVWFSRDRDDVVFGCIFFDWSGGWVGGVVSCIYF